MLNFYYIFMFSCYQENHKNGKNLALLKFLGFPCFLIFYGKRKSMIFRVVSFPYPYAYVCEHTYAWVIQSPNYDEALKVYRNRSMYYICIQMYQQCNANMLYAYIINAMDMSYAYVIITVLSKGMQSKEEQGKNYAKKAVQRRAMQRRAMQRRAMQRRAM